MPRYLIFAGTPPNDGGMNDYHASLHSYENIEPYLINAIKLHDRGWWHVVDVKSCRIILTDDEFHEKYRIIKCHVCGKTVKVIPKSEELYFDESAVMCLLCEHDAAISSSTSTWCDLEERFCGYLAGVTKEKCKGCEELPIV